MRFLPTARVLTCASPAVRLAFTGWLFSLCAGVSAAEEAENAMMDAFAVSGTDVLELTTDGDLLDAVVRFTTMRKQQARSNFNAEVMT